MPLVITYTFFIFRAIQNFIDGSILTNRNCKLFQFINWELSTQENCVDWTTFKILKEIQNYIFCFLTVSPIYLKNLYLLFT